MIRSLNIGTIRGMSALIELVNNDKIILDLVTRENEKYEHECRTFSTDGSILELSLKTERYKPKDQYPLGQTTHSRSEFAISINPKQQVIRITSGYKSSENVMYNIEQSYKRAEEFYQQLRGISPSRDKDKLLKNKLQKLVHKIKNHDYSDILSYTVYH